MNKRDRISEIIERVLEIPVSVVISRYITLKKKGNQWDGLCPFHGDHKLGSFKVTDSKGIFKCFSCGEGGNSIQFVKLFKNLNYIQSVLHIAYEHGLINADEYEELSSSRVSCDKEAIKVETKYNEKKVFEKPKIADAKTLNLVYRLFAKGCTYLGKERLSLEHRNHLLNERNLTEEEIKKFGYFTFPTKYVTKHFLKALEKYNLSEDVLKEVPGFFYNTKKESWDFTSLKGLGIPIMNEEGLVVGIQVRKDTVTKGQQRYIWFSSSFTIDYDYLEYGTSIGAPTNVVIPDEIKTKTIFITEGHFKAIKIAKEYSSVAISVQGVCSWKSILKVIKHILEIKDKHLFKYIYIAYDGDMTYNTAVFLQAINMGLSISGINPMDEVKTIKNTLSSEDFLPDLQVFYCVWDDILGKGIDDLINNGNGHMIEKVSLKALYNQYNTYMDTLKEIFEDMNKIPKEDKKDLFECMILTKLPKYMNM